MFRDRTPPTKIRREMVQIGIPNHSKPKLKDKFWVNGSDEDRSVYVGRVPCLLNRNYDSLRLSPPLVCDVGGGGLDFNLRRVSQSRFEHTQCYSSFVRRWAAKGTPTYVCRATYKSCVRPPIGPQSPLSVRALPVQTHWDSRHLQGPMSQGDSTPEPVQGEEWKFNLYY